MARREANVAMLVVPAPRTPPHCLQRDSRSPSPAPALALSSAGYDQYRQSLLEVPGRYASPEYGEASSDDLSSEWDSDVPDCSQTPKSSGWRKIKSVVHCAPFVQNYKNSQYYWIQLAGHQGNFKPGPSQGTVLKKVCTDEEAAFEALMQDALRPFVPEYKGKICEGNDCYLHLQDLLSEFSKPCVMDCKMGVRTYLEEELHKARGNLKLRKDMYEKMIAVDPNEPTEEERRAGGVTKTRYMVFRETMSSTATLGFRIEGLKKSDGQSSKDFKTTKDRAQILQAFREFTKGFPHAATLYVLRLRLIKDTLSESVFFRTHEVIGSSLLFVHDAGKASVWLIDFAKSRRLLSGVRPISHDKPWREGNHEDGYLIGLNNLIDIFAELDESPDPPADSKPAFNRKDTVVRCYPRLGHGDGDEAPEDKPRDLRSAPTPMHFKKTDTVLALRTLTEGQSPRATLDRREVT